MRERDWSYLPALTAQIEEATDLKGHLLLVRDAAIRGAFADGWTQGKLADATGLTRQRIQQICGKDEER